MMNQTHHDGEVTWWPCAVCGGLFELEDVELLEDDEQACLRCVGKVPEADDLRAAVVSSATTPAPGSGSVA